MGKPSGFDYGWVVVAAGALMTCVGFGTMLSLAVFLQPISEAMGWSRAGVSAAATPDFLCTGVAAFFWGTLPDRGRQSRRRVARCRARRARRRRRQRRRSDRP